MGYIGYTQIFTRAENDALKIITLDMKNSENQSHFTITVTIKNTGRNDIADAELNTVFIKDNDIVDTQKQSISLQTNQENTYSITFPSVSFRPTSTYKAITTIYFENMLLDTKTVTKQFP